MKLSHLFFGPLALVLLAPGTPAHAVDAASPRGHLILIGGGSKPEIAMAKFVELTGGKGPIVVFPTATEDRTTGAYYQELFAKHGCRDVQVLDVRTKKDAADPKGVETLKKARGVFFSGGDQNRITEALLDTPMQKVLDEAWHRGIVLGGTSAGTACMSDPMMVGEGDFETLTASAVQVTRGLGFMPGIIVDQHFVARQRHNRLLTVILERPGTLGVGVDENTALWVKPDMTAEVIGERWVLVYDPRGSQLHPHAMPDGKTHLGASDIKLHILNPGDRVDLVSGRPTPSPSASPKK